MARSRFIADVNNYGTWSLWWVDDHGEAGGALGDIEFRKEPQNKDDKEIWRACNAAKPFVETRSKAYGYEFATKTHCMAARRAADAAIRNTPVEEWEARALAAGWKPPKGWRKA
jgi:hypothetical protein